MSTPSTWMARALIEAHQARGWSSPNPPVGAVIVRDGRLIAVGRTQQPGSAHAEIQALTRADQAAQGADLYVTLEPCCHFGRTPPCVDAIIDAGIRRVFAALSDPNPAVQGGGFARLRAAGVEVVIGDGAIAAADLIEGFSVHIRTGRPLVIAKYAMSLDGRVATSTGQSRWITGSAARDHVHGLRATVDAILVGAGTVLADDPTLTARPSSTPDPHQPLRVVLDSTGRLPTNARVFDPELPGRALVASTEAMPLDQRMALADRGVETLLVPASDRGVDVAALLDALGERDVTSLLVEGGSRVHASFFEAGLVHKVISYVAPVIIGGDDAPGPVGGHGVLTMDAAVRLAGVRVEQIGSDLLVQGYVPAACEHVPLAGCGRPTSTDAVIAVQAVEVG